MQVGTAGHQGRHAGDGDGFRAQFVEFDQPELDFFQFDRFFRAQVKAFQQLRSKLHVLLVALDLEMCAATGNAHIERILDLLDVFIQRAAKIGQADVVFRF